MRKIALVAVALLLTGCVTSSDMEKLQSQISDLQEQVAALKKTASSKEEVQNVNTRIAEQTQTLLKSNATLVAKVDQIEERMQTAQGSVEQTSYRIDRMAQQLAQAQHDIDALKTAAAAAAAAAPPVAGMATAPMSEVTVAPTDENPSQIYQAAYRDYQRGNFDLAISGFRDYLSKFPQSDLADNAAYWIGESLYSQKKYREAIEQFDSVVNGFPKSDKVPSALLKKGYAYVNLGEKSRGIVQLQYVVHEHPRTAEAAKAREELKKLGVETQ